MRTATPVSTSAFDTIRTSTRRVLSGLGMLRPAFDAWRFARDIHPKVWLQNRRLRRSTPALPIPPAHLIYSVCGTRSVEHFLTSGEESAAAIRSSLQRAGRSLESQSDVLDMGCGCGRVLRHMCESQGPRFYGTDYNPAGVSWVRDHFPFVDARVNTLEPPLSYPDETLDVIYAVSVLTHLPLGLQRPWMEEFRRVLRPGGALVITLCGTGMLSRLIQEERNRFNAGELVVVDEAYAGTNMCTAYHPDAYVHGEWSNGFTVFERTPHTSALPYQDQWTLLRL